MLTSWLRRLSVPLITGVLVTVVIIVALVVLDLGGPTGDSISPPPVLQIGGTSAGEQDGGVTSAGSTTLTTSGLASSRQGSGAGLDQAYGTTHGENGFTGPGSTIRAGKTKVVTGWIRVQPGQREQQSTTPISTSTTEAPRPPSTSGAPDSASIEQGR